LDPRELKALLDQIDPLEFRASGDLWQSFLFAVHYATRGTPIAKDLFIDWCLRDPQYAHHGPLIASRWDSLHYDKDNLVTTASLRKFVAKRQLVWPRSAALKAAQQAFTQPTPQPSLQPQPPPEPEPTPTISDSPIYQVLLDEIGVLNPGDPNLTAKLNHYIEQGLSMGVVALEAIKTEIGRSLGLRVKAVDQIEREARSMIRRRERVADQEAVIQNLSPDLLVTQAVLSNRFAAGRRLLHAPNQQFYYYSSTHWKPLLPNILTKIVFEEAEKLKTQSLTLDYKTVPVIPRVEVALKAKTAQAVDLLGFAKAPKPVYNTLNYEVHLDTLTGSVSIKGHSPQSYLNYCLNTAYDNTASAPLFDRFLGDLFDPLDDPQAAIRTIEEILGYIIQPYKPFPLIILLKGSGSNGKTSLLDIITALVGPDNVLPRSVLEFGNTGRNNHAFASLPGKLVLLDDDMGTEIRLPASTLKKLSENKLLEANPKGLPQYNFVNTSTPVILTNSNPQIPDLSRGLQRRLVVVPFNRYFAPHEQDPKLVKRIIDTELPGVFQRLLLGAQRLFKRGALELSAELKGAVDQVSAAGNQLRRFLFEATRPAPARSTPMADMYQHYRDWAINQYGAKRPYTLADFEAQLGNADYLVQTDSDGVRVVEGLTPWSPADLPDNVSQLRGGA
jgi:P4 family phage/plasmid primase-like protien